MTNHFPGLSFSWFIFFKFSPVALVFPFKIPLFDPKNPKIFACGALFTPENNLFSAAETVAQTLELLLHRP